MRYQAPWTDIGNLQQNIDSLKTDISRKANQHEISSLNSKMDSLECELRETRTEINGLQSELQRMEEALIRLESGAADAE